MLDASITPQAVINPEVLGLWSPEWLLSCDAEES